MGAALAAAEIAVLLLRPKHGLLDPLPVDPRELFSAAQIERAEDYRGPQLALYGASLALQAGVLILLIRRGVSRRPLIAGAAVSLALVAATLPVSAISRQRGIDVGLVTRSWGGWAVDVAQSAAIGAGLAAVGALLAVLLRQRFGSRWWLPGSVAVVFIAAGFVYAGPLVVDPSFNRFRALPAGELRSDVLVLAERAGVEIGEVYEMDASKRTTAANAYVAGLGSSKRVVIYDNLIRDFTSEETRLVVAHELAHVHYRDLPNGLLYVLLVAPFGVFAIARLTETWSDGDPRRWVPALALALAVVSTPVTLISNQLSRAVEARADAYALQLAGPGSAATAIAFQRRIALQNVSDPDPPVWRHAIVGTHPTTVQRVGIAERYAVTSGR